jgi:hypothetical protein
MAPFRPFPHPEYVSGAFTPPLPITGTLRARLTSAITSSRRPRNAGRSPPARAEKALRPRFLTTASSPAR